MHVRAPYKVQTSHVVFKSDADPKALKKARSHKAKPTSSYTVDPTLEYDSGLAGEC